MVTNQDWLGTNFFFPEKDFLAGQIPNAQNSQSQRISFSKAIQCGQNFWTWKCSHSKAKYWIADRILFWRNMTLPIPYVKLATDRRIYETLQKNLGSKANLYRDARPEEAELVSNDWDEIYKFLKMPHRTSWSSPKDFRNRDFHQTKSRWAVPMQDLNRFAFFDSHLEPAGSMVSNADLELKGKMVTCSIDRAYYHSRILG